MKRTKDKRSNGRIMVCKTIAERIERVAKAHGVMPEKVIEELLAAGIARLSDTHKG